MTVLGKLEFTLTRELVIRAPRATVFRYFTDSERWARWWGPGSTIDGRRGGAMKIVYPGGVTASGEVLEIRPPERIVFSYGYDDPAKPIAAGGSRVTISLAEDPRGTRLSFLHEVADAATREQHVPGWRYQLALFANVVASEAHAGAAAMADRWFSLWNEADAEARLRALAEVAVPEVEFRDAWGCTRGLEDLAAHVAAVRIHMPGLTLTREGEPRQCQGTALVEWVARKPDGKEVFRGSNVFELAPDGRIASAVGLSPS